VPATFVVEGRLIVILPIEAPVEPPTDVAPTSKDNLLRDLSDLRLGNDSRLWLPQKKVVSFVQRAYGQRKRIIVRKENPRAPVTSPSQAARGGSERKEEPSRPAEGPQQVEQGNGDCEDAKNEQGREGAGLDDGQASPADQAGEIIEWGLESDDEEIMTEGDQGVVNSGRTPSESTVARVSMAPDSCDVKEGGSRKTTSTDTESGRSSKRRRRPPGPDLSTGYFPTPVRNQQQRDEALLESLAADFVQPYGQ